MLIFLLYFISIFSLIYLLAVFTILKLSIDSDVHWGANSALSFVESVCFLRVCICFLSLKSEVELVCS